MAFAPITPAWTELRPHQQQSALWRCDKRFVVIEAARRSGKTQLAKRDGVRSMMQARRPGWRGVFAAPTRDQAKEIYWEDLKALTPDWIVSEIVETKLKIRTVHGAELQVAGLDKPKRLEGIPTDKIWVDELADVKPGTWDRTLRPLLSTDGRPGKAWLYGVPRPSTQFATLARFARDPKNAHEWAYFFWGAAGIVSDDELRSARETMDPLTFAQEYEAKRVSFSGRAYHQFEIEKHAAFELAYDPEAPLEVCFDFNNAPGVAALVQELPPPEAALKKFGGKIAQRVTSVVGCVWIPRGSNTDMVAAKVIEAYGNHKGRVRAWGDASGGSKHTSSLDGSDWAIIESRMRRKFGNRFSMEVPRANGPVRLRVNSLNARLFAGDGVIRMLVCPKRASRMVDDLDGVMTLEGTAGELDKDTDPTLTHLSDALGYYVVGRFPLGGSGSNSGALAL